MLSTPHSEPVSKDKIDAELKYDPFPDCNDCLRIVRDTESSRQRGEDGARARTFSENEDSWSASQIFHSDCVTCTAREESETPLCTSCQHLRLEHLSFCMKVEDLPENVPVPRSEVDASCPLCQIFDYVAEGKSSAQREPLGYPMYLTPTRWRDQEVQWRVTGERWGFNGTGAFLVVQRTERGAVMSPMLQDETIHTLKYCLQDCSNEHSFCQAPSDIRLPEKFRLIDIKDKRIVLRSDSDISQGYVALSYVWGSLRDIGSGSSTNSNIAQMSTSMDILELPKTIRDAIQVCEKLGERYIWVDRLCIVQDNEDDKFDQIHAMAGIYSAAKLVIVAASGDNMDAGLSGISQPRNPQKSQIFSGIQVNVQLAPMWDTVDKSTWNSRAWTYQEVILAKRKLFFTEAQVYFECVYRINHEETLAYPSFDPSFHDKDHYPTSTTSLTYNDLGWSKDQVSSTILSSTGESSWKAYQRHVPRYRHRKLSHESDLLNALTGILNALYPESDIYHGLPLPELDIALLWTRQADWLRRQDKSEAKLSTLFPSWSWASSPAEIPSLYNVDFEFYGTLCLWFRPRPTDGQRCELEVVLANTKAAASWRESTGYLNDNVIRVHMARALQHGLVESWIEDNAIAGQWEKPSAELETFLQEQWPKYPDFWNDVFGRDDTLTRARGKLQGISDKLKDGLLVTRAQVARLKIKGSGTSAQILNDAGEKVGWYVDDTNHQVAELQRNGQEKFEFIALSVSGSGAEATQKNAFEDSEGNLPKVLPIIKAMIVRREGDYYYRIGLTQIYMKCWVELNAPFQTVLLA
ncbi:HET-domain-containing protein [Mollisia scopiformis]|uniref:HET-domain-containing protein n=1 Tax=Mollisia scopiformis TaxID=149040 RepID=A0A194X395_MOLSC|nr:HET-domain-containing protein [Mollisia scopiformis]KUJ14494.1 HET-domain-containing protein [Mollisia scopiformis]